MSIRLRAFRVFTTLISVTTAATVLAAPATAAPVGPQAVNIVNESAASTPANPGLTLISAFQSTDTSGETVINALIENTGGSYIEWPGLLIGFYDKAGNKLGGDTDAGVTLHVLAPGERSGFSMSMLYPAGYDHFKVLGLVGTAIATPPDHNFSVGISDLGPGADGGTLITGTITNRNTITAGYAYVQLMFFDAAGRFLGADPAGINTPDQSLAPGQTATFYDDYLGPPFTSVEMTGEDGSTPWVAPSGCISCVPFSRVSGSTRVGTAIAASKAEFADGVAKAVVLARSDKFPDALAGGPLAAHVDGPLLLINPTGLDAATQAEIQRVAPSGSTVYILGGSAAIPSSVDDALTALGYVPDRIYGDTRFATAVAIAKAMGNPTTIFEATGLNYPDALAGGPAAAATGGAILLTNGSQQAQETTDYLATMATTTRYALGGPAAKADPSATPIVGADRFDTSNQIARKFFPSPTRLGIATAYNFPDALGAGPLLASEKAPLVLVPSAGALSSTTYGYLIDDAGPTVVAGTVFGGTVAVSNDVVTCAQMDLAGSG